MITLPEGYKIEGYIVQYFIKEGLYNGTYRISDEKGNPYFMKLYDLSLVPEKLMIDGEVEEIVNCRRIRHDNVISHVADGELEYDGQKYQYLITDYFYGTLLSSWLNDGSTFPEETAKAIIAGVLNGLLYLNEDLSLNHNDITARNIILDKVDNNPDTYVPRIIDLGHVHEPILGGGVPFPVDDLTLNYCAPETLAGIFSYKSDAFSAMAVLYQMLTSRVPWPVEFSEGESYINKKAKIRAARKNKLDVDILREKGVSNELIAIISKGLSLNENERPSVKRLLSWLEGSLPETSDEEVKASSAEPRPGGLRRSESDKTVSVEFQKTSAEGGGFADIAGMEELKDNLRKRVIWVLTDREKAARYHITPPNGMILYGPPGCGKTFFAQKFAEESHFNYVLVNGSDLGSSYIHGTQGKIAELFKEAVKHAPTIICFDEFDAFVPKRSSMAGEHRPDEINEFLSQLNNCSERGIFVIGTTNRLDMIDPAVLRHGRMDIHWEIPAPDTATREAIFRIHLKGRPLNEDINYTELAEMTDNYASADLAYIVNEAAMAAAMADELIGHQHLVNAVKCNPSRLVHREEARRKIGF